MVDSLFQVPMNSGTHNALHVASSLYEYLGAGLGEYNLNKNVDGFYLASTYMKKMVVHITNNFFNIPNIKVPVMQGIWGVKDMGKY